MPDGDDPLLTTTKGAREQVDLVVSDLDDFVEGEDSHKRFGSKRHELFIEAKDFQKGFWGNSINNALASVQKDAANQAQRLKRGHCLTAALFVVDDENVFEDKRGTICIPDSVEVLVASPREQSR